MRGKQPVSAHQAAPVGLRRWGPAWSRLQLSGVKEVAAAPRPVSCAWRNPISSHCSLLSHPVSNRGSLGRCPTRTTFPGPMGEGETGGSVTGWNRAEDSNRGETETIWHREYQHRGLRTKGHGARDRTGSQGPTASPSAQGRAAGRGAGGVGTAESCGQLGRRTRGWPGSPRAVSVASSGGGGRGGWQPGSAGCLVLRVKTPSARPGGRGPRRGHAGLGLAFPMNLGACFRRGRLPSGSSVAHGLSR